MWIFMKKMSIFIHSGQPYTHGKNAHFWSFLKEFPN